MTVRTVCFAVLLAFSRADAAPVSLADIRAYAAAHAPAIARATLAVDGADAARDGQRATYDPQLELDAGVRRDRAQPRSTAFTQPLANDSRTIAATIARVFPGGAETRIGVALARDVTVTRVPSAIGHDDLGETTISPRIEGSVRQPLWGGRLGGGAVATRLVAERAGAIADRQVAIAAALRDAERAYWQLYLAGREVAIREAARAAAEAQLRQVEAEIARGARPRLAAIEIEDALARLREDELIAGGAVGERSLELARSIGMAPTEELRAGDVPVAPELADEAGPEPQRVAAAARIDAARAELVRAEDEARWRIDAVVQGSLSAPRDRTVIALSDTASYGGWSLEVGLSVRAPLTDRGGHAKIAGARARLAAARIAERELDADLATEAARLRDRRGVARARVAALARSVELATANLTAERNRWDRGDTTAFELLRRQSALADVELRLERAKVDELDAAVALAALHGRVRS